MTVPDGRKLLEHHSSLPARAEYSLQINDLPYERPKLRQKAKKVLGPLKNTQIRLKAEKTTLTVPEV